MMITAVPHMLHSYLFFLSFGQQTCLSFLGMVGKLYMSVCAIGS